tara:strand:- start:8769 stop:9032 length:264 start_codon:yes stop_codon:yes gene_type:complete
MADEIRIDEVLLNRALDLVNVGGEQEHRLLYHIINQIAEMGHRWRSEYQITLFNGDSEPNFDEKYAEYLDRKAQKEDAFWGDLNEEE